MQSTAGGQTWTRLTMRTVFTEHAAKLTAVVLIRAVDTVPVEVTPAVQVNTLPAGTGKLFGRAAAGGGRGRGGWRGGWRSAGA